MNNKKSLGAKLVGAPYYLWAAIFTVVPICIVIYYSFTDSNGNFTINNLGQIGAYLDTFILSICLGAVATAICLVIAYPIAFIISQMPASKQRLVLILVMLPMWINLLLRTYSLMNILEDEGIINNILSFLNLPAIHLINTKTAVVIGMVYNFLPYMILPIYTVMSRIETPVLEASKDLGSNWFQTFLRVVFPLSIPGIMSGITMVFVPSVSTFYISQKLGGTMELIGDTIDRQFNRNNDFNSGAALSFILMIMIFICMAVMNKFSDEGEETIVV